MKVETHNVYDPEKPTEVTLKGEMEYNLESTDLFLEYLKGLKPEIVDKYVDALESRLTDVIEGNIRSLSLDLSLFDLSFIQEYPSLVDVVTKFILMHLGLTEDTKLDEKIMVTSMRYTKSFKRLAYHKVKALVELLGVDEGVPLYKEMVAKQHIAGRENYSDETLAVEMMPGAIKNWTNSGFADFAVAVLDDHRVIYRFDRCLVPESLKDLNDPDIAYLSSCYTGDSPEWNPGKKRHMRRTQTLHHASFCDEFYWDQEFCPDAEQPKLEFTESLGK